MGIKKLNDLIKKYAPNAIFEMPMGYFYGKRIAIDAYLWLYANYCVIKKDVIKSTDIANEEPDQDEITRKMLIRAVDFTIKFLKQGITPVFIIDGEEKPELKGNTLEERNEKKTTAANNIDNLRLRVEQGELDLLPDLQKSLNNYNKVPKELFENFMALLHELGVPYIQAYGEADKLAAALCIEGQVAAVYSKDTDNLVYGCPLVISEIVKDKFKCVRLDYVLTGLKFSHIQFVDLCIMSGCDYNTNIPRVASLTAFKLITDHKSIDHLPTKYDPTCLNHIACRKIFSYAKSETLAELINLDLNLEAVITARDFLTLFKLTDLIHKITPVFENLTIAENGYVVDLNLKVPPKYSWQMKPLTLNITSL